MCWKAVWYSLGRSIIHFKSIPCFIKYVNDVMGDTYVLEHKTFHSCSLSAGPAYSMYMYIAYFNFQRAIHGFSLYSAAFWIYDYYYCSVRTNQQQQRQLKQAFYFSAPLVCGTALVLVCRVDSQISVILLVIPSNLLLPNDEREPNELMTVFRGKSRSVIRDFSWHTICMNRTGVSATHDSRSVAAHLHRLRGMCSCKCWIAHRVYDSCQISFWNIRINSGTKNIHSQREMVYFEKWKIARSYSGKVPLRMKSWFCWNPNVAYSKSIFIAKFYNMKCMAINSFKWVAWCEFVVFSFCLHRYQCVVRVNATNKQAWSLMAF